jgi:hypothetical protein
MDVVGSPIEAFEVVVCSNWRLEDLRWSEVLAGDSLED